MYLYKQESKLDFRGALKSALKGYINGQPVVNQIPKGECHSVSSMPSSIQMHIMLDDKEDAEILKWLKGITRGRRNNMIKNIFRNTFPPIEAPYKQKSEHNIFK